MDKANVVHINNVIIFSCKEINPGICRKMGGYGKYPIKQDDPVQKTEAI